jgi:hypothetical protein
MDESKLSMVDRIELQKIQMNEIALRQMLAVIVLKHHNGHLILTDKEITSTYPLIGECNIESFPNEKIEITIRLKEETKNVATNRKKETLN